MYSKHKILTISSNKTTSRARQPLQTNENLDHAILAPKEKEEVTMTVYLKGYSVRVRQGFVTGSHGNFHFRNSHTNPEHAPPQLCHGRCFALLPEDPFYGLPVKTYETFPIIHKLVFK